MTILGLIFVIFGVFCPILGFRLSTRCQFGTSRFYATTSSLQSVPVKPVPKVPASAWKWPPVWPFPPDYMDIVTNKSMYNTSSFSTAQIGAFQRHFNYYVPDGSIILEIGLQKESILPTYENSVKDPNIQYLALSDNAFEGEKVIKVTAIGNVTTIPLPDDGFDIIIMSTGVESLINPRDFFRDVWRILKPRGKCIICFSGNPNIPNLQPVKMWTTMTAEQKIWIAGSYYQYSAGEGWENIEG